MKSSKNIDVINVEMKILKKRYKNVKYVEKIKQKTFVNVG